MDAPERHTGDWFWEGNIQDRVLAYLAGEEGYTVLSPGEAVGAEQGIEIVAERALEGRTVHRLVSVRGWPSPLYTQGSRAGQPRATRPEVIARSWIAQAVLDLALARGADPDVELSLALPAMASYIRYLQRLRWFLAAARASIYLVAQDGRVSVTPPGAPPVPAGPAPPATPLVPALDGKRRKLGLPGASRLQLPLLHALVQAGGSASRTALIGEVARWFPAVPAPPPAEFGQRLSVAQRALQVAGLTTLAARGVWCITEPGRALYAAEWPAWRARENDS